MLSSSYCKFIETNRNNKRENKKYSALPKIKYGMLLGLLMVFVKMNYVKIKHEINRKSIKGSIRIITGKRQR